MRAKIKLLRSQKYLVFDDSTDFDVLRRSTRTSTAGIPFIYRRENYNMEAKESLVEQYQKIKDKNLSLGKKVHKARCELPKTICQKQKEILEDHFIEIDKLENSGKVGNIIY